MGSAPVPPFKESLWSSVVYICVSLLPEKGFYSAFRVARRMGMAVNNREKTGTGGMAKVRRGEHPNSRANLCPPWSPGESGNPNGRPVGSYGTIRRLFAEYMAKPIEEIEGELRIDAEEAAMKETLQKKERVQCSTCQHKDLALIDGLLTLGIPVRTVSGNYGLTRSAIERHKQNHLPVFPRTEQARSVVEAETVLPALIEKLKSGDQNDLMRETWPVFNALWKAFENTLDDSPQDRLRLCLATACAWLYRIQGRDYYAREANLEDVRAAVRALESW